jgi:alkylated DNA repair dioxygenase AlkB
MIDADVYVFSYHKDEVFSRLKSDTPWQQRTMNFYGKEVKQPRLTAWFGDPDATYVYSGIRNTPLPWTDLILEIRDDIEKMLNQKFNSVLLNYYRDGQDSIGFHSDNEKELGPRPVIVSLSFGVPRTFVFKHKSGLAPNVEIELTDGVGLVMSGATQENWEHGINKAKYAGGRINMTFRNIIR